MANTDTKFLPLISSIQKIALYETRSKFYLVGSNNVETKFRVIKIDRSEPFDLMLSDDKLEYSEEEVHQILTTGCKSKTSSLPKPISAFGIVGFVRFKEGYYLILITKRRQVAAVGMHIIYKIEDTNLIYIPYESYRIPHIDESRYVKMFQSVDLSSNFYFSYSYDITNSLQVNMATPDMENVPPVSGDTCHGYKNIPKRKFVWNSYLLNLVERELDPEWAIYVMHGFIGQCNISIFGRSVYVTLIARRSNKYAGTRFLKRGSNSDGDVANEVETEQLVIDNGFPSVNGLFRASSFVQLRGSVPGYWSQEMGKIRAKPAINFDLADPYFELCGLHLNELLKRYGSPIMILNLVKKREKKKHESQLSERLSAAILYLNQFLPPHFRVHYIPFDMARMNKGKESKVMDKLAKISKFLISKTGFFSMNVEAFPSKPIVKNNVQTGIIRVNCVDCLDRTNTAQFALGKCALALQLHHLGLLHKPILEFDTDCVRLLEVLYEDHGDTLALQYGGSQLVHRIKTYRKTAPWTSHGNDIMQTLSRYYSNTFSDADKQHAINLFLGLYVPKAQLNPIWEQNTDYYLHNLVLVGEKRKEKDRPLTQWWEDDVLSCLPYAHACLRKQYMRTVMNVPRTEDFFDLFAHYHRTDKICFVEEMHTFKMGHSIRDYMPQCVSDFSPFIVRKAKQETSKKGSKNPSLTGKSSNNSTNSSTSSFEYNTDEGEFETRFTKTLPPLMERQKSLQREYCRLHEKEFVYGLKKYNAIQAKDSVLYNSYVVFEKLTDEKMAIASSNVVLNRNVNYVYDLKNVNPDSLELYGKCRDLFSIWKVHPHKYPTVYDYYAKNISYSFQ